MGRHSDESFSPTMVIRHDLGIPFSLMLAGWVFVREAVGQPGSVPHACHATVTQRVYYLKKMDR